MGNSKGDERNINVFAVVAPSDILGFLSSQTEITRNCELTLAYENEIKPTPMKKAIVALGVEKMTVGDYLTETAADGSVTVTSNRQADLVLKISIFAPYSYGSYETHKILDRIVTAMLYSQKLYTVTSCESGGVHYVRDTGALVLDTYFTLSKVFPNRHTQKGTVTFVTVPFKLRSLTL